MTIKRHTKQPDKKLTDYRVEPTLSPEVANSDDTPNIERLANAHSTNTEVSVADDISVVDRIGESVKASTDIQAASDERTPTTFIAPVLSSEVNTAPDSENTERVGAPRQASTDITPAPDSDNTERISAPRQASIDINIASDTRTVETDKGLPAVNQTINVSDDTVKLDRIGQPLVANTEIPVAENYEVVERLSKPLSVPDSIQVSPDERNSVRGALEPQIEALQQNSPDAEAVERVSRPVLATTEVSSSDDTPKVERIARSISVSQEITAAPEQDSDYKRLENGFTGRLITKGDAVRIGLENYSELKNLRYTDYGLEGVGGCTRINANTTTFDLKSGIQLKTNYTKPSYVLAHGSNSGVDYITANEGTIPNTSNFDYYKFNIDNTNNNIRVNSFFGGGVSDDIDIAIPPNPLYSPSDLAQTIADKMTINFVLSWDGSLTFAGTYSLTTKLFTITCTGGTVGYVDAASTIGDTIGFTEDKARAASISSDTEVTNTNVLYTEESMDADARMSLLPNGHIGVCNGYETLVYAGEEMPVAACLLVNRVEAKASLTQVIKFINEEHAEDYTSAVNNTLTTTGNKMVFSTVVTTFGASDTQLTTSAGTIPHTIVYTKTAGTSPAFAANGLAAGMSIEITGTGLAAANEGIFKVITVAADAVTVENKNGTVGDSGTVGTGALRTYGKAILVGSTRKIRGITVTMSGGNSVASTLKGYAWTGTTLQDLSITDGTASGGATLAIDGEISWTSTAFDEPAYFAGRYLYWFMFLTDDKISATISQITANAHMQDALDIWDGEPRTCLLFNYNNAGVDEDYTLEVSKETYFSQSTGEDPYVADLSSATQDTDYVDVVFSEPICALKFRILNGNTTNAVSSVYYKANGLWTAATVIKDTTANHPYAGSSQPLTLALNHDGVLQWYNPGTETKTTIKGVEGYAYRIRFSANLSADVKIDLCHGIPLVRSLVNTYSFPFMYKNRAMWCNSQSDKEYSRVDYSAPNAPDVYNGLNASGLFNERSVYVGDKEALTGAVEVYGLYGDSVDSRALFFKKAKTHMLAGDSPETYKVFPVSETIGCPAPHTIATAEVSLNDPNAPSQQVALWLSDKGPVMFIGNTIRPIYEDIKNYFEDGETVCINRDYINLARGGYDPNYRSYNIVFPSGDSDENDTWFAFDLHRFKWYQIVPTGDFPTGGFIHVEDSLGNKYLYGLTAGGYMTRLENGLYWSGTTKMEQVIKTADLVPSGSLWQESTAREIKLLMEDNDVGLLTINHYLNGSASPVQGIVTDGTDYYKCNVTHVSGSDFATDLAAGYWTGIDYWDTSVTAWAASTYYSAYPAEVSMNTSNRYLKYLYNIGGVGFSHAFEFVMNNCIGKKPRLLGWSFGYDTQQDKTTS